MRRESLFPARLRLFDRLRSRLRNPMMGTPAWERTVWDDRSRSRWDRGVWKGRSGGRRVGYGMLKGRRRMREERERLTSEKEGGRQARTAVISGEVGRKWGILTACTRQLRLPNLPFVPAISFNWSDVPVDVSLSSPDGANVCFLFCPGVHPLVGVRSWSDQIQPCSSSTPIPFRKGQLGVYPWG